MQAISAPSGSTSFTASVNAEVAAPIACSASVLRMTAPAWTRVCVPLSSIDCASDGIRNVATSRPAQLPTSWVLEICPSRRAFLRFFGVAFSVFSAPSLAPPPLMSRVTCARTIEVRRRAAAMSTTVCGISSRPMPTSSRVRPILIGKLIENALSCGAIRFSTPSETSAMNSTMISGPAICSAPTNSCVTLDSSAEPSLASEMPLSSGTARNVRRKPWKITRCMFVTKISVVHSMP